MKYLITLSLLYYTSIFAQTLNLPPRNSGDETGSQLVTTLTPLSLHDREVYILNEVMTGNVPSFYRNMVNIQDSTLISGSMRRISYYVIPDYLAIGSDADYFLCPMTPILGQVIADSLDCILPTSKMVDQIWYHATVKMQPQTISPSPQMTTVPVFDDHNVMVKNSRQTFLPSLPLGELVSGDKKDVIISNLIYTSPAPARVVIYGWHYPTGGNIQPRYAGHIDTYADYSHGIRLVQNQLTVDGVTMLASDVLSSSSLHPLLSDEGVINQPFYPDTTTGAPIVTIPVVPTSFCIINETATSATIKIKNDANVDQYQVYQSLDGVNFSGPSLQASNNFSVNCTSGVINYFKIKASNSAGASGFSEVLGIIPSPSIADALIVNGFDRNTTGNTKDFIVQHGKAIANYNLTFSSATNEAITDLLVNLNDYKIADYILGEESTANETFSNSEQTKIENYLNQGGYLFVSGAEIGWDLDHLGSTTDISFFENYLKADYIFDSPNDETGVYYQFEGVSNSIFQNVSSLSFDNGTNGVYNVQYPDVIVGINGGQSNLLYSGLSNNFAGVNFHGLFPNAIADSGKLVYLGFPFETIYPESSRFEMMDLVLDYFLAIPDNSLNITNQHNSFELYPNPFTTEININLTADLFDFVITNIHGQIVNSGRLTKGTNKLNLANLTTGFYVITLKNNDESFCYKIVKN